MNILIKLAVTSGLLGLVIMLIACIAGMITIGSASLQSVVMVWLAVGVVLVGLGTFLGALWAIVDIWSH